MRIKHIVLGILLVFTIKASAQLEEVPVGQWNEVAGKNKYFKDINGHFNKFIGTWEYSDSDKYFKVQFYKINKVPESTAYYYIGNVFHDYICSFIEYKEKQNGQWVNIYNTFGTSAFTSTTFSRGAAIQGYSIMSSNTHLRLKYTEPSEDCLPSNYYVDIKHQGGNPTQLLWSRGSYKYVGSSSCNNANNNSFKIPADMVLTKIAD